MSWLKRSVPRSSSGTTLCFTASISTDLGDLREANGVLVDACS